MADIVIRGVDMPKGDLEYVSLWVYGDGRVYVSNKASTTSSQRLQDLAVLLPEGHGRLIDADALEDMDFESCDTDDCHEIKWRVSGRNHIRQIIKDAPIIVPAEGGGEE